MEKERAYGGVLFDPKGRILLRKPSKGFGGYAWTYPKGKPDPGEKPEETALREVREETGYDVEILAPIPGGFEGDTSITFFYVMRPKGRPKGRTDQETGELRWVLPEEAPTLINETPNPRGRKRDLAVLDAAVKEYAKLTGSKK